MLFKKKNNSRLDRNIDARTILANLTLFVLIVYFIYHSLNGNRGLFAYFTLKQELSQQADILRKLEEEKAKLELKAKLLHPKTLELDMLDEQARRDLSMIAPDEKVVILDGK